MLLRGLLPGLRQCIVGIRREFTATPSLSAIPFVIENEGRGERSYDIYSRLLRDRIVCVMTPITYSFHVDDFVASSIIAQLLFLQSDSSKKPIHMYINSPGGSVTAGLAIYDTMQMVTPPVATWCVGQGTCSDIIIRAEEIQRLKKRTQEIYVHHTGQTYEVIQETLDRDRFMSAYEAMKFGIIDKVESHKGSMPTE
ncbi:endopeptidase Clp [Teladorsagia circumcincta]|uniref:ATP-dependent Clp protease proteolytic subunit n=1 Tax=Teladorsagia circumcincta TaxID=45464 RepID=A0A2G9U5I3_TELCI|nr:endopeptidase Clp [Teladorsagia circumcincta]